MPPPRSSSCDCRLPLRAAGRAVITLFRIQIPQRSVRSRLYGSGSSTVNVGNLIPLLRRSSSRINAARFSWSYEDLWTLRPDSRSLFRAVPAWQAQCRCCGIRDIRRSDQGPRFQISRPSARWRARRGREVRSRSKARPVSRSSLYTHGKIPAKRVLVIGGGPRGDFTNAHIRDVAAAVAQIANKAVSATVAFVLPALGASREQRARPARRRGRLPRHVQVRPLPHERRRTSARTR